MSSEQQSAGDLGGKEAPFPLERVRKQGADAQRPQEENLSITAGGPGGGEGRHSLRVGGWGALTLNDGGVCTLVFVSSG